LEVRSAHFHLAAYEAAQFPRDGLPQFAIAGRSNVGKSSLINTILRKKNIAKVSQTPGKTRGIHFYMVNGSFYVVDLPGYGYAKVSKSISASWGSLIRGYLEREESLRSLFLLLDCRRIPSGQDLDLCAWLDASNVAWHPVLTKIDKLSNNQMVQARAAIAREIERPKENLIAFSMFDRRGSEEIWRTVSSEIRN